MCITFWALPIFLLYDSVPFVLSQVLQPINSSFSQTSVMSILTLTISTTDMFRSPTITPQNDLIPVSSTLLVNSNELSMPISTMETSVPALVSSYQAQILHFNSNNRAISTTIEWITRSASLSPSTSTTTVTYLPDGSEIALSKSAISTTEFTTTTHIPPESPISTTDTGTRTTFKSTVSSTHSDTTTLVPIYPIYPNTTTQIPAESTIPTKITSTTNQISYESTILTIDLSTQIPLRPTTSAIDPGTPALTPTHTVDSSSTTLISAYTTKSSTSHISSKSATFTTDSSKITQVRTTQNSRPSRSFRTSTIETVSTTLDVSTKYRSRSSLHNRTLL
ncbi:b7832fc0-9722-41e1-a944-4f67cff53c20-CDS [Sclerotinia trifoliorum]|uniref:B7832fc0-9722-41e1-a944-4f67cff53c20-CDS n=1 Tax=Sclerotinia trifoliorum TaxID=28548 RepID=A0A8H2ZNX9_9HELO|nr:b7832fc0-9722-41e1-a944-4f67cff53c20-CDS [Sclerotinia trifoliorum]